MSVCLPIRGVASYPKFGCHESLRYSRVSADAFLRTVESCLLKGAQWVHYLDRNEMSMHRDTLLALGDGHANQLFKMLDEHGTAKREHLKTLFAAERMKPMARMVRQSLPWV